MKMKLSSLILALIALLSFSSCKKYLDKKANSAQVIPNTLKDLQAILDNSIYMNSVTAIYGETSSDDYFVTDAVYNSLSPNDQSAYRWSRFDYSYPNDWASQYFAIYNANICLENISKISQTSQNSSSWNNIKGSALFFRAYYLLNLAWCYSKSFDNSTASVDLGVPIRLSTDINVSSNRPTIGETYDRIIQDATESLKFLPDNPLHPLRPSKAAAYGLLARTYLSMSKFDSAYKYSNLSLSIKNKLLDFKTDINTSSSFPFQTFNAETIFYSEMYSSFLFAPFNYFGTVDTVLYNSYTANDLRRSAYFQTQGAYKIFKGNYTGGGSIFSGIATDEMFFIRSECLARLGDKNGALADLNTLLAKRYNSTFVPVTASTSDDALNIILTERRKELLFRGLRWIDIKRLNKEGRNIVPKRLIVGQTYTLQPNSDRYALPLPQDIIDVSKMPQNPGW
jgi:hypothetical protein